MSSNSKAEKLNTSPKNTPYHSGGYGLADILLHNKGSIKKTEVGHFLSELDDQYQYQSCKNASDFLGLQPCRNEVKENKNTSFPKRSRKVKNKRLNKRCATTFSKWTEDHAISLQQLPNKLNKSSKKKRNYWSPIQKASSLTIKSKSTNVSSLKVWGPVAQSHNSTIYIPEVKRTIPELADIPEKEDWKDTVPTPSLFLTIMDI